MLDDVVDPEVEESSAAPAEEAAAVMKDAGLGMGEEK